MYHWLQRLLSGGPQGHELSAFMAGQAVVPAPQEPPASEHAYGVPTFEQRDGVNAQHFNWLADGEGEPGLELAHLLP